MHILNAGQSLATRRLLEGIIKRPLKSNGNGNLERNLLSLQVEKKAWLTEKIRFNFK